MTANTTLKIGITPLSWMEVIAGAENKIILAG
jgi:hypothetical protein